MMSLKRIESIIEFIAKLEQYALRVPRKRRGVPKTSAGNKHFGTLFGSGTGDPAKLWSSKF
jgi:hypothetical protein